ncbi:MAG: magnesium and cobalt transport protein CorA [Thermoleophilia bacterium]|nr:magnesium and cobalt transport protein CorA [Thermoleophilia bacterium]
MLEPHEPLTCLAHIDEPRIRELIDTDTFFWLDLERPTDEEIQSLGALFGFHELALEDATKFGQRPKVDEYGDHLTIVYFGAEPPRPAAKVALVEVHVFVHGGFVVTVRRAAWQAITELRRSFELLPFASEQFVPYRILDALTDTLTELVDSIERDIDEIEEDVVQGAEPEHAVRIMALKHELATLRRTVGPQRDVAKLMVSRLAEVPGLDRGAHDYFRDVHDHMIRVDQGVETSRMLIADVLSVYMAGTAQRQNEATERLNVIATIFLPLSFVVGFFGQNFAWMTDHVQSRGDFLLYGGGSLVVSFLLLVPVLRLSIPGLRRRRDARS